MEAKDIALPLRLSETRYRYNCASAIIAGACCLIIILGQLFSVYGRFPVKGFWTLSSLASPLLAAWAGILLRYRFPNPKWPLQIVLGVIALLCFCTSCKYGYRWMHFNLTGIPLIIGGFLLPIKYLWNQWDRDGWLSGILFLISTLAYCSITIVLWRLMGVMKPEYSDMEQLCKSILAAAQPLTMLLPVYFALEFSFSNMAMKIGQKKWFRISVAVIAVLAFLRMPWGYALFSRAWIANDLMQMGLIFVVQPAFVGAVVFLVRFFKKRHVGCVIDPDEEYFPRFRQGELKATALVRKIRYSRKNRQLKREIKQMNNRWNNSAAALDEIFHHELHMHLSDFTGLNFMPEDEVRSLAKLVRECGDGEWGKADYIADSLLARPMEVYRIPTERLKSAKELFPFIGENDALYFAYYDDFGKPETHLAARAGYILFSIKEKRIVAHKWTMIS